MKIIRYDVHWTEIIRGLKKKGNIKRNERKTWAVRNKPIKWRSLQLTTLRSYTFSKSTDVARVSDPELCVCTCIILQCNISELHATRRRLCLHFIYKAFLVPIYKQSHISPLLLYSNKTLSRILKKERSLIMLENKYWGKFYVWFSVHHNSIIYKEPTRCNFGSIVY